MTHSSEWDFDPSTIAGDISDEIKQAIAANVQMLIRFVPPGSTTFAESIQQRLKVVEFSIKEKADEPKKTEARVVFEVDVTEDMLNGAKTVHGGCSAYLVDMCTSIAINGFQIAKTGTPQKVRFGTVSQSLNLIYHAPATLGDRLRIICTTLALGGRALTARGEIWSTTNHRLVVSGTHVKMIPVTRSKI